VPEPAARPGFIDVLGRMFGLVLRHWPALLAGGAVIFIPVGLLETIDTDLQDAASDAGGLLDGIVVLAVALLHVAGALLGQIVFAGLISALAVAERSADAPGLGQLVRHLPVGKLILADLLYVLAVAFGLALLIVPGILCLIWFALVGPALEVERLGVINAFRRSRALTRGHFWLVTTFVLPITLAEGALDQLIHDAWTWSLGEGFTGQWAAGAAASMVTSTIVAIAVSVLYLELSGAAASPRTPPAESRPRRRESPA
jgi:hypothetical protein